MRLCAGMCVRMLVQQGVRCAGVRMLVQRGVRQRGMRRRGARWL
jgi:hypothetical protein